MTSYKRSCPASDDVTGLVARTAAQLLDRVVNHTKLNQARRDGPVSAGLAAPNGDVSVFFNGKRSPGSSAPLAFGGFNKIVNALSERLAFLMIHRKSFIE